MKRHALGLRLFRRLLYLPQQLVWWPVDKMIAPLWLRLQGVEMEFGCRFSGIPIVHLGSGARIILGKNVTLYSRPRSNPRGLLHPMILAALGDGAVLRIGDHVAMTGVSINCRERIEIGQWVQIGPGACLWDNDGHALDAEKRRKRLQESGRSAPIIIEEDAFIGSRAIILKGVTVGRGAVVGAGAVVTKSIGPGEIAVGNPARVVGSVQLNPTPQTQEPFGMKS